MVDKDSLIDAFAILGVEISDDVAGKCIELCAEYRIDENELCDTWMAYSTSCNEERNPSVDALNAMRRKGVFGSKASRDKRPNRKSDLSSSYVDLDSSFQDLNCTIQSSVDNAEIEMRNAIEEVLNSETVVGSLNLDNPTPEYANRKNSGEVVCTYGENIDSLSWTTSNFFLPSVKFGEDFIPLKSNLRYMYSTLLESVQCTRKQGELVGTSITKNNNLSSTLEMHHITMETAPFAGRVSCDGRGKLNATSVILESCLYDKRGGNVKLELQEAQEYSLFPGQVVAVEGKNPDGKRIIVERIHNDAKLEMYPNLKPILELKERLQIVVACGPFMLSNKSYKPFMDLKEYVAVNKPHALILIGPLVDTNHPEITNDNFEKNFSECYQIFIDSLMNDIGRHTQVIITSSWRDASLHLVYPTPPISVNFHHQQLTLAPDPCILNISGLHIGLTAADILMHLSKEEIFFSKAPQDIPRLSRLASHLLRQKCFYPLIPPDDEMSLDPKLLFEHGIIPKKPHIMILPSDLKSFTNVAEDCVFINPGKFVKNKNGGSFARIQVSPAVIDEKWSPASHISVQVIKI